MTRKLDLSDRLAHRRQAEVCDDFHWFISPHLWTALAADTGTSVDPTISSAVGGQLYHFTAATNNNEAATKTTNEVFQILNDRPILGEARIKFVEANTDDANVAFGFADAFGADLLVNDGAGPKTSFSGALIYKVDGGTAWKCVSSVGSTQTISTSTSTAGGSDWQVLKIEIQPVSSTIAEAAFFVDGKQLIDSSTNRPIKHTMTYTNAVAMAVGAYVKAGGSNAEILVVDYINAVQLRPFAQV